MARWSGISLWQDDLEPGDDGSPRAGLDGDLEADVAIVGAGFSGLWTAYHLLRADPTKRVVVLERTTAGDGASGRNGGWCVGDQAAPLSRLRKAHGREATIDMVRAVQDSVDEVGATCAEEGIDCGFAKGGALLLARTEAQLKRHRAGFETYRRHGLEHVYRLLSAEETTARINARNVLGSLHMAQTAALNPARLARGIARAVERLGGTVLEETPVSAIEPRRAVTARGTVRAEVVVRATEAYSSTLAGHERTMLPLVNHMIATAPIADEVWDEIGMRDRELFEDTPHLLGYAQRTADGRLAWGGLGAPYRWRSKVPTFPMQSEVAAERLRARLVELFPVLEGVEVTHHWGGILGMPRDFRPSVGLDRATGLAWLGGYGGSGVASAQTAGRSMADLILDRDTPHRRLPWVDHRSPRWEPEPFRFVGVRGVTAAARLADVVDDRRARRARPRP